MRPKQVSNRLKRAWPGYAENAANDAGSLTQLMALPGPFLPWSPYSMRPTALVGILSDIALYDRQSIVECGSGYSTVYMARLIRQRESAATILTVDHDPVFAASTRGSLEREGLGDIVTIIEAPLVDGWYDTAPIPEIASIDLLVVDGPPAFSDPLSRARERAMDHFAPSLTPDSTVVLDDANRAGEQAVIAAWTERHRRRFVPLAGGAAISSPLHAQA
jgi:predicted O-methyltransferase YrrM